VKTLSRILLICCILFVFQSFRQDNTYKIDLAKSSMTWRMPLTSGAHYGSININSGYIVYDGTSVNAGTFVIDLNTVKDMDLEKEKQPKIEAHIKSEDFFETATYPYATFVIDQVGTDAKKGLTAYGKLTIKGITKPISFPFSLKKFNNTVYVVADKIEISRKAYGIVIKNKGLKGKLEELAIDDIFIVNFSVALHP